MCCLSRPKVVTENLQALQRALKTAGLWCKSQSALAFVADSVRERPVSRAFWQKQISTLLFQLNDLHQNRFHLPARIGLTPKLRTVSFRTGESARGRYCQGISKQLAIEWLRPMAQFWSCMTQRNLSTTVSRLKPWAF